MLFHSDGDFVVRVLRQAPTTSAGAPAETSSLPKSTVSPQEAAAVFIDDLACERKIEQNGGQR